MNGDSPDRVLFDRTGNLPPLPGSFPDYSAPIVRNIVGGQESAAPDGACHRPVLP
jgi:hypothetical protein